MNRFVFIIVAFFVISESRAQTDSTSILSDSVSRKKEERKKIYATPRKASIMSAALPGLGQIYNRKYWKVPVIYAALGGFGYMFAVNNKQYKAYRQAVRQSVNNGGVATIYGTSYLTSDLQSQKLYYRKFRDFAGIGIAIVYLLNIVDANVDAHLKTFDVSDDLSFKINPWLDGFTFGRQAPVGGLTLKINFK